MHPLERQHALERAAVELRLAARHLDRAGLSTREGNNDGAAVAIELAAQAMERGGNFIEACVAQEVTA